MGTASTKKFIKNSAGALAEEAALTTSAGAGDAHRIPALNGSGILDDTIINATTTASANKIPKLNGAGVLDDTIINATQASAGAGSAGKVIKLNASGLVDDTALNATQTSAGAGSAGKVIKLNASGLVDDTALNATTTAAANKIPKLNGSGILDDTIINASVSSAANKIVKLNASGKLDPTVMPPGIGDDAQPIIASEALAAGDLVNIWNNAGVANVRKADASTVGKEAHGYVLAAFASAATATVYFEGTNTQMTAMTAGVQFLSATTAGKTTATPPSAAGQVVQRVGFALSASALNFQSNDPIVLA